MSNRKHLPMMVVFLLVLATPFGLAGHTDADRDVTFDHKTGNEWWVEVLIGGDDAAAVTGVDARDTDGDWVELEKKSWGAWAASFHIEPGHLVQFRAHADGETEASCWFTHPEGEPQCSDAWRQRNIGITGGPGLTMGDVDDDAATELLASGNDVRILQHDEQGWSQEDFISTADSWEIDTGDLDHDGDREVAITYMTGPFAPSRAAIYDHQGGEWVRVDDRQGHGEVGAVTIGDVDGDGRNSLFVTANDAILRTEYIDGEYVHTELPLDDFNTELWIGDADGDGDAELVIGGTGELYVGDLSPEWEVKRIGGAFDGFSKGVAVGDADGDGEPEVYITRTEPKSLWRADFDGAWHTEQVATFDDEPNAMFLGDVDGDGLDEVVVATDERGQGHARLFEISMDGGPSKELVTTLQAQSIEGLIVGDGDHDGQNEVYLTTFDGPGGILELSHDGTEEETGASATFDSRNGNEWWVQVRVTDADPTRVQAQDTGDPWKELELKDWGDWAASFHVEPGNDVRYRAMVDGEWVVSCWFTHPEGKAPDGSETCSVDGSEPPPDGDFDASFDTPGGNEWWVEVYVDGNEPIAGVDARDDGGKWIALEKKDWGAWAKSFHVEDGSIVEFRAASGDGDRVVSDGYRWPSGDKA